MNTLRRRSLLLLIIMSLFLPFWLTFGKLILFGVGGWLAIIYAFTLVPVLFISLWIFFFLLRFRPDVRTTKTVGAADSLLLLAIYVSIFLHGIFIVDGGDSKESIDSVATKHFGMSIEITGQLGAFFLITGLLLIVACFTVFIYELVKKRVIFSPKK